MFKKKTRAGTAAAAFGVVASLAAATWWSAGAVSAAAPATVLVDGSDVNSDVGGCGGALNPCNTIQEGVNNANPGGKVSVAAGTYPEQVVIGKNLTLEGNGVGVVMPPAIFSVSLPKAIIIINGGARVTVQNLTISGPGSGTCNSLQYGVAVLGGAHANILHNSITDIRDQPASGCQNGVGILVGRTSVGEVGTANIFNNEILDFQKGGIVVDNGGSYAAIRENDITGFGPVPFIAQNGIQVSRGAKGQVRDNDVMGSWYTGANWTSTGILIFESSDVIVQRNHLDGNQTGITAEAWCWTLGSYTGVPANNNKIDGNVVEGAEWGVVIDAVDFPGYSGCDPAANNNKVVNNIITSMAGAEGVFVGTYDLGSFTPRAVNNKIINNKISGFATDVLPDGDSATKIHANRPAN